jgi:phage-related protein
MASRFGGWVESVGGDIANLGKAFGSEMESWGGQIHGLATNFKNLIGDWMGDIGGLGKRFGSEVDSWGHQIGKFFQDLPGRIGGFFSSIPSALGTALGAAAYGVGSFAAQLVTDITRIPGAIGSAGRAIGSQVESWSGDLKNLGENFYGMVESWGPKIDAFVTGSGPAIGNWAKSWTSDIVATGARFTSMVTSWGGDIYKFGQTLTTGAGTWGNAIGRFVTSAGRDIGSWATSFGSAVANISTAVGGFVVNTLPQWWDRATTAVENFMYSLLSDIGGLPGKIMGYFGDAGSWLYNAGRNIITGLWQGVSDEAGRFFGWMGGLKDSFVHGWQQHWQSGSPSQVAAREMGLPIAQGIALGITQGTGLVTSSLTSVIPQGPVKTPAIAMPGLSVALAAGTATSAPSSSATTTQNDLLTRIANSLGLLVQQSAQNSPTSSQDVRRPTTGIEGKVYDLVQQVQQTRARGIRGNYL